MRVYFAHSMRDYNSSWEHTHLKKIEEMFPGATIYNPNQACFNDLPQGSMQEYLKVMHKYFFPVIDESDVVCAFKDVRTNEYTDGVKKEMIYAKEWDITVLEM